SVPARVVLWPHAGSFRLVHCDSVALPDGPVNLYRTGDGPPVVLLHGLLGSPAYLLPLARALANERQVLVPELPGHGASAAVRPFTFARAADQLAAAVAAFTDQPPAVLGHSLGAPPALPEMLEQLLECDLRPAAEAVRCPVLVAWGERDAHSGNGPALASALRADTLIIPGVGHMPMLEAPFAFRRALRGWL